MSELSKRRWFQIHLSTAIVLALVSGGLMHLSFLAPRQAELSMEAGGTYFVVVASRFGFPLWVRYKFRPIKSISATEAEAAIQKGRFTLDSGESMIAVQAYNYWYASGYIHPVEGLKAILNILTAISLLGLAAFIAEHFHRRRLFLHNG